ncbi:MAG: hypothetical protein AAFO91_17940 [Bacteroidota bacterium]
MESLSHLNSFRNDDGSYRFFDNSDDNNSDEDDENQEQGSTWLTASVYGTYGRLMRLEPWSDSRKDSTLTMDMDMAYEFLSSRQMEDGSMEERGPHVHPMMQGNETSHKVALTAHVLVNIVNANLNDGNYYDGIPIGDDGKNRMVSQHFFLTKNRP